MGFKVEGLSVGDEGGINRETIPASSTLTWYLIEQGALSCRVEELVIEL